MRIVDKFRTTEKLSFETTNGNEVTINQNTFSVKLDNGIVVAFTKGAQQFYDFMSNAEYYQPEEILLHNIIKEDDAIVDTIDDDVYFKDTKVYSVILFRDIVFLMMDE